MGHNRLKTNKISALLIRMFCYFCHSYRNRDVAQSGSVHAWGAWGRRFKSCHPDLKTIQTLVNQGFVLIKIILVTI